MTKKDQAQNPSRLIEIELDEASIGANALEVGHERKVAIFDLLEENHFELVNGPAGPYRLRISMPEHRLAFAVTAGDAQEPSATFLLSLNPFHRVVKDYFLVLGELLRGDQIGPAKPDRSARHGPPRPSRRGQQAAGRTAAREGGHGRPHVAAAVHPDLRPALEGLIPRSRHR